MNVLIDMFNKFRMALYNGLRCYEGIVLRLQDRFHIDDYEMMLLFFVKGVVITSLVFVLGVSKVLLLALALTGLWVIVHSVKALVQRVKSRG